MSRPLLFGEASERIHVRLPLSLASRLEAQPQQKSRLVSATLEAFFQQHDKASLLNELITERQGHAALEKASRMLAIERGAYLAELRRVRSEAADESRSLRVAMRSAPPEMRERYVKLWRRMRRILGDADARLQEASQ